MFRVKLALNQDGNYIARLVGRALGETLEALFGDDGLPHSLDLCEALRILRWEDLQFEAI